MQKLIASLIAASLLACSLASCEGSAPPVIKPNDSESTSDQQIITLDVNEQAVELLSKCDTNANGKGVQTNNQQSVFTIVDSLYILGGRPGAKEMMHELNFSTGNLNKICKDPLCDHKRLPCPEAYFYISYAQDNDTVYVLGEYMKTPDEGRKFIGELDVKRGAVEIISEWLPSSSAASISFEYHDGYLYYTNGTSDTTNALYRYSIADRKEELVSGKDEYIVAFTIGEDSIFYRDNYLILKRASMDFKTTEKLDDGASIIFTESDKVYYFKNAYNQNGEQAGFTLNCFDLNTDKTTVVLSNVYNPSKTLFADGSFYYTMYNYESDKTVYVYDTNSGKTSSYPIGIGSRCDVLCVYDGLLILKIFTEFDPSTGQRDIEYHLYDTATETSVQIYCE